MARTGLVHIRRIERTVHRLRGHNVILDRDLADLYRVDVRALNQAVGRNRNRFPADFMFRLTASEAASLRSQTVISNGGRGGRRFLPYAFTEQGVAMLSSVLRSARAVRVNIEIMRTFVRLRQMLDANVQLARKLDELERKCDDRFEDVFDAIRKLMSPSPRAKRPIGFATPHDGRPHGRLRTRGAVV
jgi:ORF6N domain-containing protein